MTERLLRRGAPVLAAALLALGLSACSSTMNDAATVSYRDSEGEHTSHVERQDFEREVQAIVSNKLLSAEIAKQGSAAGDFDSTTDARFTASLLRNRVNQAVVDALATSLKITPTDADRKKAADNVRQSYGLESEYRADAQGQATWIGPGAVFDSFPKWLQEDLVAREARNVALAGYFANLKPEQVKAFWDRFHEQYCPIAASHILVPDKAKARAALAQINGGKSFADVAKTASTDTQSGAQGGDLGCVTPGKFIKVFEDAAVAAPTGKVVGPVKSEFGYHLIVTRPSEYEDAQAELTQILQQGAATDIVLSGAKARIDPRYGTIALGRSQSGASVFNVTPPVAPKPATDRETGITTTTTFNPTSG